MIMYFLVAKLMFNIEIIIYENIYRYLLIILIYYLFLLGFGMISGAYTILFKRQSHYKYLYLLSRWVWRNVYSNKCFPNILIHLSNFIPTKKS